jgi:hypothetical protein
VACDNTFVFLLVEKCIDSFCGFCFEIYADSIQEIERGSFFMKLMKNPHINIECNLSPEVVLDICSQEDDTLVFYILDNETKIEVFSKNNNATNLIIVDHNINPSDVFLITAITTQGENLFEIFYKLNDTWYLCSSKGEVKLKRKIDGLKDSDKFCVTRDGYLILMTRELDVQLFD